MAESGGTGIVHGHGMVETVADRMAILTLVVGGNFYAAARVSRVEMA